MQDFTQAQPNRQIVDEASAWFVDFRVGDIDAGARERFSAWLRRSPEHIQAYFEIARTYAELPAREGGIDVQQLIERARVGVADNVIALGSQSSSSLPSPSAGSLDRALATKAAASGGSSQRRMSRAGLSAGLAAVVSIVAVGVWAYSQRDTYSTDIGEQHSITLADGSIVEMNALSRVRIRYGEHERSVELIAGQALFRVAPEKQRPFVVDSGGTRIRALGTQFDVYRKATGTTVTVLEGRVAVRDEERRPPGPSSNARSVAAPEDVEPIVLTAGQQVKVAPRGQDGRPAQAQTAERPQPMAANIAAVTAWTQRQLVFDNSSLSEVAEEFNRYSARRMVIDRAGLEDFHVSGIYSSANAASLLRFLRAQPGISVEESADEIRIVAR